MSKKLALFQLWPNTPYNRALKNSNYVTFQPNLHYNGAKKIVQSSIFESKLPYRCLENQCFPQSRLNPHYYGAQKHASSWKCFDRIFNTKNDSFKSIAKWIEVVISIWQFDDINLLDFNDQNLWDFSDENRIDFQ